MAMTLSVVREWSTPSFNPFNLQFSFNKCDHSSWALTEANKFSIIFISNIYDQDLTSNSPSPSFHPIHILYHQFISQSLCFRLWYSLFYFLTPLLSLLFSFSSIIGRIVLSTPNTSTTSTQLHTPHHPLSYPLEEATSQQHIRWVLSDCMHMIMFAIFIYFLTHSIQPIAELDCMAHIESPNPFHWMIFLTKSIVWCW